VAYGGRVVGDTMRGDPATPDVLSAIEVPTLVMSGGDSPPFLRGAAEQLASIIPTAQYRELEGQGHGVDPSAIAPILTGFFGS
jgi:pimeloyl-ACP methyl ester carboxylesterase